MNSATVSQSLIIIDHLSKQFTRNSPLALDDIHAELPEAEMIGLVGPDGSGKSTLIRLIAGLLIPSKGSIHVANYDTKQDAEKIHAFIGYMPQKFGLYEDLTVLQNMQLYADLRGLSQAERRETFDQLLSFTTLQPFTGRLAKDLSGGMKQKLGLACALIKTPRLLLLDEPTVGVDPISRRELIQMVQNLVEKGISVIWSTAYLDEAERCFHVLLLNQGKLIYSGSPQKLTQRVEGHSFQIQQIKEHHRQVLVNALNDDNITDGVIQGSNVRIVIKEPARLPSLQRYEAGNSAKLVAVPPRFEDAFVDILGGHPGGTSVLAQNTSAPALDLEIVIEAKELTKKFGSFIAANKITFSIRKGEIFGLLGPNGAGKSTTFKMMCGLLTPTEGAAYVCGLNLQKASSQARRQIGYMAQKFSLYGNLSTLQNLEFFSGIYGLQRQERSKAIQEMVQIFNLSPYLSISADLLPLGIKQRLALACAVMHKPPVLFLDEPTSGVDPLTRREFWTHINGLVEKGVTVMITTHFMDEAEYCDRIALVYQGKIIQIGSPDSLKESAKSLEYPSPTLEDAFIELVQRSKQTSDA